MDRVQGMPMVSARVQYTRTLTRGRPAARACFVKLKPRNNLIFKMFELSTPDMEQDAFSFLFFMRIYMRTSAKFPFSDLEIALLV